MSQSSKPISERDANQATRFAFNDVDKSVQTSGFLTGKVGHKITQAASTTTSPNDTLTFTYFDGATVLYAIQVIYTDNTYATMISAERIS